MAIQLPAPPVVVAVESVPRDYPHVDGIPEWQTQQSLRLAWDQIAALQDQVRAIQGTQTNIIAAITSLITAVGQIQILAEQAYAKTQQP